MVKWLEAALWPILIFWIKHSSVSIEHHRQRPGFKNRSDKIMTLDWRLWECEVAGSVDLISVEHLSMCLCEATIRALSEQRTYKDFFLLSASTAHRTPGKKALPYRVNMLMCVWRDYIEGTLSSFWITKTCVSSTQQPKGDKSPCKPVYNKL